MIVRVTRVATGVPGFANETKPLAASNIFISISDLLGDAMLIYRCWFPWGDHRWVVLPLALPAIAGFACMLQSIHFVLSVSPTSPVPPAVVVPLTTAGFALPLCTNVMATALIILRIWQLTGQSAWSSSLNSSRRRADVSSRVTAMFVESGLLYLAAQLVFVVLIAIKHPAQAVLAVIAIQIYGITPKLIVIRGAAGYPTGTVVGIASEMVWTPTLKETFNDPPTAFDSADEKQPKSTAGALWALAVLYVVWKASALVRGRANTLAAIAGPAKENWLTGNFHRIFKDGLRYNLDLFRRYGSVIKVHGMLGVEQLLVYDPLALQHILVKDADAFEETDMFIETNKLLFGDGLISTLGQQHRKQRKLLNPVFSLANLRAVLPRIQPIANELVDRLRSGLPQDGGAVEMDLLPWLRMGTIEYVGRGILGIDFNCLDPAKASDYVNAISTVHHQGAATPPFRTMGSLRELREMARLMDKAARQMFLSKKAEVENAGHDLEGSTTDLMSIMIRANSSTEDSARLSEDELVGQINTFALAGQETTTSALARLLWVLAQEPPAQTRLRSEVREAKITHARASGMNESEWQRVSLPYDVLIGLPYLDAVVRETLRLYPSTNMMYRVATKDATLPLHRPIRSSTGEELSTVYVPKGTNVIISILGANRNTHVWGPDANEWRPERWLAPASESDNAENRAPRDLDFGDESVMSATLGPDASSESKNVRYPGVFGSMMTFLGGSRACLGFKFAEMEIKQILATLISTMHFDLPSAVDEQGERKEVYWRIDGLQVPVVRPPHGDLRTAQAPFDIRLVKDEDFLL
ncbi:hypothetical protein ACG7TL_009112 [Trametes sanguinea]